MDGAVCAAPVEITAIHLNITAFAGDISRS
jgi:hypothetical protein